MGRGKRVVAFERELSKVKLFACGERRHAKTISQSRRREQAGTVLGNATGVVKKCL